MEKASAAPITVLRSPVGGGSAGLSEPAGAMQGPVEPVGELGMEGRQPVAQLRRPLELAAVREGSRGEPDKAHAHAHTRKVHIRNEAQRVRKIAQNTE